MTAPDLNQSTVADVRLLSGHAAIAVGAGTNGGVYVGVTSDTRVFPGGERAQAEIRPDEARQLAAALDAHADALELRVLVCGSRDWPDRDAIRQRLDTLPRGAVVIHGCAKGADSIAGEEARKLGLRVREFPAEWDRLGKRAGIVRNLQMLEEAKPHVVIAFRTNDSRGTTHMIEAAKARGVKVEVHGA